MTQSTRHRGIGALTREGRRRGWQAVGRAAPRLRADVDVPARPAVRPAHEGSARRRPLAAPPPAPTAPAPAPWLPDVLLVALAMLSLLFIPVQFMAGARGP